MTEQIRETEEEVLTRVARVSWTVMDEDQRAEVIRKVVEPRYNAVTKDGVRLGPTWWANALGAETPKTIEGRVYRIRRSGGQSEPSSTATPVEVRRVKSDIQKPDVLDRALSDPKVVDAVASNPVVQEAVLAATQATRSATEGYQRQVRKDTGTGATRVLIALDEMASIARKALPDAQDAKFGARQHEVLDLKVQRVQAGLDLLAQAAESDSWDDELVSLLESEV